MNQAKEENKPFIPKGCIRTSLWIDRELLKQMASVCRGNVDEIQSKLFIAAEERKFQINRKLFMAQMYVHKLDTKIDAHKELKALLKALENYQRILKDISEDIVDIHMYSDITPHTDDTFIAGPRYLAWENHAQQIDNIANIYREILSTKKPKKLGRPNNLRGLTEYVIEMAELYQLATGKKFTRDDHRINGIPYPITEGQKFVEISLSAIYETRNIQRRYTSENFQNACQYAAKHMKLQKS